MKATNYNYAFGSGNPLFSGNLVSSIGVLDAFDDLEEFYSTALTKATDNATERVQQAAMDNPQWKPYARYLTVTYENGHVAIGVTGGEGIDRAVQTLEYGSPTDAPNSLIRRHIEKETQRIMEDVTEAILRMAYGE